MLLVMLLAVALFSLPKRKVQRGLSNDVMEKILWVRDGSNISFTYPFFNRKSEGQDKSMYIIQ
jgi:hypothetical protein